MTSCIRDAHTICTEGGCEQRGSGTHSGWRPGVAPVSADTTALEAGRALEPVGIFRSDFGREYLDKPRTEQIHPVGLADVTIE